MVWCSIPWGSLIKCIHNMLLTFYTLPERTLAATHTSMTFELEVINSKPLYKLSLSDVSRVNSNYVHNAARPNYFSNEKMNGSEACKESGWTKNDHV